MSFDSTRFVVINTQNPITGPQGFQGVAGPIGFQGTAGTQGFQGIAGPQGFQGPIAGIPTLVSFSATAPIPTGGATVIDTPTVVVFSTVTPPNGIGNSAYNPATGIFTAPTAGRYFFTASVNFQASAGALTAATTAIFTAGILLNGVQTNYYSASSGANNTANEDPTPLNVTNLVALFDLVPGDTVAIDVFSSGSFVGGTIWTALGTFVGIQIA